MSDRLPAQISIGGRLKRKDVALLCDAIAEEPVSLTQYDEDFRPKSEADLIAAIGDDDCLCLYAEQAALGRLETIEECCHTLGLFFSRLSGGDCEYSPECVYLLPGMAQADSRLTNPEGNFLVFLDDVDKARRLLEEGRPVDALFELSRICGPEIFSLPPLEITDDGEENP